jgi:high-affinity nickel permease
VALIIGTIELGPAAKPRSKAASAFIDTNFRNIGYFVVGLFVVTWAFSVILWKPAASRIAGVRSSSGALARPCGPRA